jgi:hypothetical protein
MPGQFINRGNTPGGNLKVINKSNAGSLAFTTSGSGGGGVVGQWYLASDQFGWQPAWTYGVISWPMNTGNGGINYGTTDPNEILVNNSAGVYIDRFDSTGVDQTALLTQLVGNVGIIRFEQGANQITFSFVPGTFTNAVVAYNSFQWVVGQSSLTVTSTSNTSFVGYPDGDNPNGGGPLTYTGSGIAPNNTELVLVSIIV